MSTPITSIAYVSDFIGGDTADFNDPYMSPGVVSAVYYANKFYTMSTYDEGGQENVIIDLDQAGGFDPVQNGGYYTHGFGVSGGTCVATNSTYVYLTIIQGNEGGHLYDQDPARYPSYTLGNNNSWSGILRKNRSTMTPAGGFTGATGYSNAFKIISQYLVTSSYVTTSIDASLKGLTCTDTEVYYSDPYNSRIGVLDAVTMSQTRSFTISNTGYLTVANDGNLWSIIGNSVKKIDKTTGTIISTVTFTSNPEKLGTLSTGSLWISDSVTNQILICNNAGTAVTETYGVSGGIVGNNGLIGGKYFGSISGFARNGNYSYVIWRFFDNSYGTIASKHDDNNGGQVVKQLHSTMFIECPDISKDGTEIHSRNNKFTFTQKNDEVDGTTTFGSQTSLIAFTYDPNNALADYRGLWFTTFTYYREFLGKKFLFDTNQAGTYWTVREIVPNINRTRPCGLYRPNLVAQAAFWVPPDDGTAAPLDGDWDIDPSPNAHVNMFPDNDGTYWKVVWKSPFTGTLGEGQTYVQRIPCLGLDVNNNPIYQWSGMTEENVSGLLSPIDAPQRFYYDSTSDTGILCGITSEHSIDSPGYSGWAGTVFVRFDNWRNGPRTRRWTIIAPYGGGPDFPMSVAFDGDLFTIGNMSTSIIRCYQWDTGVYLGQISSNGVTGSNISWIDSKHGHRVKRLNDKNYRIISMREIGGSCLIFNVSLYRRQRSVNRMQRQNVFAVTSSKTIATNRTIIGYTPRIQISSSFNAIGSSTAIGLSNIPLNGLSLFTGPGDNPALQPEMEPFSPITSTFFLVTERINDKEAIIGGVSGSVSTIVPLATYTPGSPNYTYTGASGTYVDSSGSVQTAGTNVLRDAHYITGTRTTLLTTGNTFTIPHNPTIAESTIYVKFMDVGARQSGTDGYFVILGSSPQIYTRLNGSQWINVHSNTVTTIQNTTFNLPSWGTGTVVESVTTLIKDGSICSELYLNGNYLARAYSASATTSLGNYWNSHLRVQYPMGLLKISSYPGRKTLTQMQSLSN